LLLLEHPRRDERNDLDYPRVCDQLISSFLETLLLGLRELRSVALTLFKERGRLLHQSRNAGRVHQLVGRGLEALRVLGRERIDELLGALHL
jgi:hypothetical protein